MTTFSSLGVSEPFIKGIKECGILTPTPIQQQSIPYLLQEGADFIGKAQTGTGKTAAFGLPLLQRVNTKKTHIQALILAPTRELGQQIAKQLFKFTKYSEKIFVEGVFGGSNIDQQISRLRRPTHIVVATPGRLIDLLNRKAINLEDVKTIVLDEADEMLSMGFQPDIDKILEYTHGRRNIWLFSATIPDGLKKIISTYMANNALKVEIDATTLINKNIEHKFLECKSDDKLTILIEFLKTQGKNRGIIFCKTKVNTQVLSKQLISKNYSCDALHGDLMQSERDKVMRAFKNTKLQILIATDMAARGIDIDELSYVVHYHLPEQIENFTHRSGRTARAGKKGISLCLIEPKEITRIREIEKTLGISLKKIPW